MLGQFIGTEPDDRQHPEQPQAEPCRDGAVEEPDGNRHDADVDTQIGDRQITAVMSWQVDGEDEDADRDDVGQIGQELHDCCLGGRD